jgi:hypothetical protein
MMHSVVEKQRRCRRRRRRLLPFDQLIDVVKCWRVATICRLLTGVGNWRLGDMCRRFHRAYRRATVQRPPIAGHELELDSHDGTTLIPESFEEHSWGIRWIGNFAKRIRHLHALPPPPPPSDSDGCPTLLLPIIFHHLSITHFPDASPSANAVSFPLLFQLRSSIL